MKKLLWIFFALALLTCKTTPPTPAPPPGTDDETLVTTDMIEGKWDMEAQYICDKLLNLEQTTQKASGGLDFGITAKVSGSMEFVKSDSSFKGQNRTEVKFKSRPAANTDTTFVLHCPVSKFRLLDTVIMDTVKKTSFKTTMVVFDNSKCPPTAKDTLRSFSYFAKIDQNGKRLFLYATFSGSDSGSTGTNINTLLNNVFESQCEGVAVKYSGYTYRKRE